MAQLAILGHPTRGNEVIKILEMLGGKNENKCNGSASNGVYIIDEEGFIDWYYPYGHLYNIFTLEDFLEKFPYKVGDKVCFSDDPHHYLTIMEIWWNDDCSDLECTFYEDNIDVSVSDLHPYKEETMDRKNNVYWAKLSLPDGYEFHDEVKIEYDSSKFEIVKRDNEYYVIMKQPQYPKTYEECCEVLDYEPDRQTVTGYDAELIENLQTLKMCRDAYWKIAGEQLELDKPWEPDYTNPDIDLYVIINIYNRIEKAKYGYGFQQCILTFPTEEMRAAFYENFKELIERCKEIL